MPAPPAIRDARAAGLRARVRAAAVRTYVGARRRSHALLGMLAYRTRLYRRFFRGKAVVLLFHRLGPRRPGDTITATPEEFRAFCDHFRRYFIVVPLATLLDRLARGEDVSRHLVITFDDGYRDNHDIAGPELAARGLTASFFITTDFIGTRTVPWWDAKLGIETEWMSWDEVRALRKSGFEIASHTRTHPDLGQLVGDAAYEEIVGARRRLEQELGEPIDLFAFPYGGPHQMAESNRDIVRTTGFRCCVSAHGGAVAPGADPFRLPRIIVTNSFISPSHLGYDLMRAKV